MMEIVDQPGPVIPTFDKYNDLKKKFTYKILTYLFSSNYSWVNYIRSYKGKVEKVKQISYFIKKIIKNYKKINKNGTQTNKCFVNNNKEKLSLFFNFLFT